MHSFSIGNAKFGEGIPVICVPVTARTEEDAFRDAENAGKKGAEVLELRADHLGAVGSPERLLLFLPELKKRMGTCLLLFTFRTRAEGGASALEEEPYREIVSAAVRSGAPDLVDIEFAAKDRDELVRAAHEAGIRVILSEHHFHETPSDHAMKDAFSGMEKAGGDIAKLAVMPKDAADVERLLQVSEEMKETLEIPHIAISMGETGRKSRISGEKTGSCMTFASVGEGSAPGQINLREMRKLLLAFHEGLL